jgi:hypothetical protein
MLWYTFPGTYTVRNEIETKRNETKSTKTKRNEINKNETKRNQQKRNETKSTKTKRNETKRNQRNENEIKTKPTEAKRNQRNQNEIENGRTNNRGLKEIKPIFTITMLDHFLRRRGQDVSPLNKNTMHLFSGSLSFWLGGSLIDTPVRAKFKSVLERRKSVTTGRTNEPNGQQKSYIPQSFFGRGIQILSKNNFNFF